MSDARKKRGPYEVIDIVRVDCELLRVAITKNDSRDVLLARVLDILHTINSLRAKAKPRA